MGLYVFVTMMIIQHEGWKYHWKVWNFIKNKVKNFAFFCSIAWRICYIKTQILRTIPDQIQFTTAIPEMKYKVNVISKYDGSPGTREFQTSLSAAKIFICTTSNDYSHNNTSRNHFLTMIWSEINDVYKKS